MAEHRYRVDVVWTGATTDYRTYSRNHEVLAPGPPPLPASADPVVGRGDPDRWNPEQLLVASLSQCHMLWYLHLAVEAGIVVVDYLDEAEGVMNARRFEQVTLRPRVTITDAALTERARALHEQAHERCFIANSVNFPVHHEPDIRVE
ncbi:OsmC family protein [Nocardia vermiculata]|uniref:OsmC family peroxiredoxin n=1 Tax=Nocardia vermiculata TaxID=257274 RepID=A0A846XUZ7_9NOCA|nr:OsmC family protein [Nocardia vermiculata]NKY49564.1 OsmC family peroxiredoxin [Nocardia vermiculata]